MKSITGISIEKPLLDKARREAKSRRQSLSAYLCTLIEVDIRKLMTERSKKVA